MDSGACADLCGRPEDKGSDSDSLEKEEVKNDVPKAKAKATLPEADCVLIPITPEAVRENGDFPIDFQSPLTVVSKQLKLACCIDSNGSSPRTPKDGVFDPFAPAPDNMARPLHTQKHLDDFMISVSRRLHFDPIRSFDVVQHHDLLLDADSLSDQDMFDSVYGNLLQVIVSKQTEGLLAQISNGGYDSAHCKTPPSPCRFTGISDTCPGAPVKQGGKPRNIQLGLCKKLEF